MTKTFHVHHGKYNPKEGRRKQPGPHTQEGLVTLALSLPDLPGVRRRLIPKGPGDQLPSETRTQRLEKLWFTGKDWVLDMMVSGPEVCFSRNPVLGHFCNTPSILAQP